LDATVAISAYFTTYKAWKTSNKTYTAQVWKMIRKISEKSIIQLQHSILSNGYPQENTDKMIHLCNLLLLLVLLVLLLLLLLFGIVQGLNHSKQNILNSYSSRPNAVPRFAVVVASKATSAIPVDIIKNSV
jgi:hypothetical protein